MLILSVEKVSVYQVKKSINIEQKCVLGIEISNGSLHLADALGIVKHFERFLIIATGRSLELINITAKNDKAKSYTTILSLSLKKKDCKDIHRHDMNFTFSDIKTEHKELFCKMACRSR